MNLFFEWALSVLLSVPIGGALGLAMIGVVHVLDWLFGDRVEPVDVKD